MVDYKELREELVVLNTLLSSIREQLDDNDAAVAALRNHSAKLRQIYEPAQSRKDVIITKLEKIEVQHCEAYCHYLHSVGRIYNRTPTLKRDGFRSHKKERSTPIKKTSPQQIIDSINSMSQEEMLELMRVISEKNKNS